jgi:hypothetical protein
MNKDKMNNEIETTLNSLDIINRAEVSPYFFTRLESKLQPAKSGFATLLHRPAIAVTILAVFFVLNIMAIKGLTSSNASANRSDSLQGFAAEYNLNTTTVYTNSNR